MDIGMPFVFVQRLASHSSAPRAAGGATIHGFLRSLAVRQRGRAVAVILSGTGSDGTLGVQGDRRRRRVVFVQEPESAKSDGMPRSAIATGCVDFILPPEGIAAEFARISREPRLIQRDAQNSPERSPDSEWDFQALHDLLRNSTGVDFTLYRHTTASFEVIVAKDGAGALHQLWKRAGIWRCW